MGTYSILGLMSGSSMDGLDIAFCTFHQSKSGNWDGKIELAKTYPLPSDLKKRIEGLRLDTALYLVETDAIFARFSADCIRAFLREKTKKPSLIASHGHTIFHNPKEGYTTQIGNGGLLASLTGIPVVSDFRTTDVGLGGQGAPLVPGAERFLFSTYDASLNLGGIANISFPKSNPFVGFDISPCNQLLNEAAGWLNLEYDSNGTLASTGILISDLFDQLNLLEFYQKPSPKSLGNEDVDNIWKPIVYQYQTQPENVLHTVCQHIGLLISKGILANKKNGKILVTGGGAFNGFLIECIQKEIGTDWTIEIPDSKMVSFKEAYCFAFLGLKRWLGETNCFSEVTGASKDSSSGAIYLG